MRETPLRRLSSGLLVPAWDLSHIDGPVMADNTTINTMSGGDVIRDLDRSAVKTQIVAHDIAQSGGAELLGFGQTKEIIATSAGLTTASTAYTAGDQLGTELSFTSAVRTAVGAVIQHAVLVSKATIIGAVDLFLFSAATTPASDNAANSWSDADQLNCLGVIHFNDIIVSALNYVVLATNAGITVKPGSGTTIFGDLVTRSGHTFFGAVGDLQVTLGLLQD